MRLAHRPHAPAEVVEGYQFTASLAEGRREAALASGEGVEAVAWLRIAQYCRQMAASAALDDDQFKFQRDQLRHRREVPMSAELMDVMGISLVGDPTRSKPVPRWKLAALELALGYLSPMQRLCLELVVGGRLGAREVGAALEMEPSQVRKHVSRARHKIRLEVFPRIAPIFRNQSSEARTDLYAENAY